MYTFLDMKCPSIVNLTKVSFIIVALTVWPTIGVSAPHDPEPNLDEQTTPPVSQNPKEDALKYMDISTPPPTTQKKVITKTEKTYFYPYAISMGPRIGLLFDSDRIAKQYSPIVILGFFHMLHSISADHIEVGADLRSDSTGTINGGLIHIYNPSEKFRPFLKAGVSLFVEPDNGLANIVDYDNYGIRVGAGIEDLLEDPASLRWDLEGTIGLKGYAVNLVFGYSWAW